MTRKQKQGEINSQSSGCQIDVHMQHVLKKQDILKKDHFGTHLRDDDSSGGHYPGPSLVIEATPNSTSPKAASLTRAKVGWTDNPPLRLSTPGPKHHHLSSITTDSCPAYPHGVLFLWDPSIWNKMSAMFSQNPLENGPSYSFTDAPRTNNGEFREHRFNP